MKKHCGLPSVCIRLFGRFVRVTYTGVLPDPSWNEYYKSYGVSTPWFRWFSNCRFDDRTYNENGGSHVLVMVMKLMIESWR